LCRTDAWNPRSGNQRPSKRVGSLRVDRWFASIGHPEETKVGREPRHVSFGSSKRPGCTVPARGRCGRDPAIIDAGRRIQGRVGGGRVSGHGRCRRARPYSALSHPFSVVDTRTRRRVRKLCGCRAALEAVRLCHAPASLRTQVIVGCGSRPRASFGIVWTVWARIRADLAMPSWTAIAHTQRACTLTLARPWPHSTGGGGSQWSAGIVTTAGSRPKRKRVLFARIIPAPNRGHR